MVLTRLRRPRRSSRDRHIAATVRLALLKHPGVRVTESTVECKSGVVLLRGRVPTVRQKQLAAGVAASVRGVAGVFNELKVSKIRQR